MSTNYDDIIAAATGGPVRTKRGALKFQPEDADWSLDRLGEVQDFYQSSFGRPLPLAVKGQGSIHNKLGYDHRSSADISLNPTSAEGQALVSELQRRKIPFIAFDRAIPGSSTGPHIHVGRASSRTTAKYGVGSQVKRTSKRPQTADTYDDIISAATGEAASSATPSYDDVISAATGQQQTKPVPPRTRPTPPLFGRTAAVPESTIRQAVAQAELPAVAAGIADAERIRTGSSSLGEVRSYDEQTIRTQRDTGMGRLHELDQPQLARVEAIKRQVTENRKQRAQARAGGTEAQLLAQRAQPTFSEEFTHALNEDATAQSRRRELVESFTEDDKQQLARLTQQLRGHGPTARGVDIGVQRIAGGLLYKIAGLLDAAPDSLLSAGPASKDISVLSDYLRRKAGVGELAIEEIEAELPPPMRQKVADFITHSIGALPEVFAAVGVGGPIGGFAALGGLEATGRKQSVGEILKETAKGAVIGGVFKGAGGLERPGAQTFLERSVNLGRSSLGIGTGTVAAEKAFGASDYDAARAAATNVLFHVGMRVPGEIGRFAQAAERALKTPEPEGGRPTVDLDLQARLSRAETPPPTSTSRVEAELKGEVSPTVPPADMTARPQSPAETPAVAPEAAAGPSVERRATPRPEGYEVFTPERRAEFLAQLEALPTPELVEMGRQLQPAERAAEVQAATRRPLSELMRERMETGSAERPAEPARADVTAELLDQRTKQIQRIEERKRGGEGGFVDLGELQAGYRAALSKIRDLKERTAFAPEHLAGVMARRDGFRQAIRKLDQLADDPNFTRQRQLADDLEKLNRSDALFGYTYELANWKNVLSQQPTATSLSFGKHILGELREKLKAGEAKLDAKVKQELADAEPTLTRFDKSQGGFVDLHEIREGLRAGKVKIEEALDRLKREFPNADEARLRTVLNRKEDPLLGIVDQGRAESVPNLFRGKEHSVDFGFRALPDNRWRYEPSTGRVYWSESALGRVTRESQQVVESHLSAKGFEVREHSTLNKWYEDLPSIKEAESRAPVHHAAQQPRTDTGQFSPGEPGGMEAARSQLRAEARKYAESFKRLDRHQARREGLDIVNDDVARNYFSGLRRMVDEFLPAQAANVDRAESLYNQGKYGQAAMLAESVFAKLPDKANEYAGANAAIQLLDRGLTPQGNWSKVLQEVRERLKRTGGLSGGGSTFYDVNKYPEGGRPDHAKIAYILEPVVEALKADARRLIAEGKLKAADYVSHVRSEVNKMLAGPEFTDWHPLNKSAAMGVLVDRLRTDGPPAMEAPTRPTEPVQRPRSLPKTLEKSERDPGTNLTYEQLPNRQVNERIETRLRDEGVDALESWYRNAEPSADRTAAHRVLVDHYTAEAVKLAETAPQRAEALMLQARELSNLEAERATTLGQAIQMYSNLLKFTPAGVMREIATLTKKGVEVPTRTITELTKAAAEHKRLDKEVARLERRVAEAEVEAGEAPAPQGATAPRPRRYTPRKTGDPTLDTSKAERARQQLDEAAKRRRAAKAFIAQQLKQLEEQRTLSGYWKRSMNITRGLMVSALSTAMRNLQSQAVRFDIERLDDLVEHTIRRTVGLESDLTYRNIWRNTSRQFKMSQTAEAKEILKAYEAEYTRMFNTYAGGVEMPIPSAAKRGVERVFGTIERGVEIANFFNRVQEFHVRSAEFLAELDLHLRKDHNQTLRQYVERNGIDAIPLETINKAVNKALEVTFADMPAKDGAGGRLITSMIEMGNYIPPTVSPVAFPRFMYNNIKFLYQHSPAGMLDLARRNQNRPRVVARALVGSSLLLLAYQFRQSDHAGEKWYELKLGDTTLDARPFGPFSTYLFIAEAIRRHNEGDKQFTVDEIAQALGASVLGAGAGLALAEKVYKEISEADWDKLQRTLKTEAGEWGRALLTPVRQVKDFIAAFDESQAVMRDTSTEPFLGPIRESIPFASTDLPPVQRPTTATPVKQERPATKAVTGWRVITPKSFLERELDRLNFESREVRTNTGIPEIDSLEKRLMGPLMDQLSAEIESDPAYRQMSKKGRAAYLRDRIEEVREIVREQAEAEQPELYEKLREDRKPRRQREFEQEQLNSPGLSSALRLGVPMSVPPMLPGEDDLAYRTRLLQLGRARRTKLDSAVDYSLPSAAQRRALYETLYSG